MATVKVITVLRGSGVTVFFAFTKPTRDSYPTIKQVGAWPTTVTVTWHQANQSDATVWTYGTGDHITRLSSPYTNVGVCTIPTRTVSSTPITGIVTGRSNCTAVGEFQINVIPAISV